MFQNLNFSREVAIALSQHRHVSIIMFCGKYFLNETERVIFHFVRKTGVQVEHPSVLF